MPEYINFEIAEGKVALALFSMCVLHIENSEFKCDLCGFGVPKTSMGDFNTWIYTRNQ